MRYSLVAFVLLTLISLTGCGSSGKKKLAQAPVRGVVYVAGKPVADGKISLGVAGEAPVILPIKDGVFEGQALVGMNRVEIRAFKDGPPMSTDPTRAKTKVNFLPEKFGGLSKIMAEIPLGGSNELRFDLAMR